ncbi:hypothetical protein OJ997_15550 [Solirubrobacter phytolaccae]|uniref:Uncharacterized protein n=1 Tax=Solirubrobacter phytolaccae TaxID=1404360 RepID=A0A9X3NAV9_9ACTN|nr:hypothetical protein [Solirubrobacter phytolaccae]MDA0181719.1 hypothetical protein [Solirubrobacter phytolaccae]
MATSPGALGEGDATGLEIGVAVAVAVAVGVAVAVAVALAVAVGVVVALAVAVGVVVAVAAGVTVGVAVTAGEVSSGAGHTVGSGDALVVGWSPVPDAGAADRISSPAFDGAGAPNAGVGTVTRRVAAAQSFPRVRSPRGRTHTRAFHVPGRGEAIRTTCRARPRARSAP